MPLGAKTDRAFRVVAAQVDRECDAVVDIGFAGRDQRFGGVQIADQLVGMSRLAASEPDLREPRACAHEDRKRARADLQIKRTGISSLHLIEGTRPVSNHAGEDVEPSRRTFRIGAGGNIIVKRQGFKKGNNIDTTRLKDGAPGQIDLV